MDDNDPPAWFAPKRYGYGASLPISWQGWALTCAFVLVAVGLSYWFEHRPAILVAILAPLIIGFIVIAARTTRGGWRWRWGEDD